MSVKKPQRSDIIFLAIIIIFAIILIFLIQKREGFVAERIPCRKIADDVELVRGEYNTETGVCEFPPHANGYDDAWYPIPPIARPIKLNPTFLEHSYHLHQDYPHHGPLHYGLPLS